MPHAETEIRALAASALESLDDPEAAASATGKASPLPSAGQRSPSLRHLVASRLGLWIATAACVALLMGSGQSLALAPLALALAMSVAVAAAGPGPWRSVVGLLPLGFLIVCVWAMSWGLGVTAIGVGSWETRGQAAMGVACLLLVTGLVTSNRRGTVDLCGRDLPAALGLVAMVGLGVMVVVTQPIHLWSRVTGSGTDFARHLFHIRGLIEDGSMPFGQVGYPRGLHAPVAWLSAALGFDPTMDGLWRAVEPLVWLMLSLALVGIMAAAGRLASHITELRWAGPAAATIAGAAFVQTAWFDTFLAFGNVMNIQVGLVLACLLAVGLQPRIFGSTLGTLTAASALAVTANAWQLLLPLTGIAVIPWIAQWVRRGWRRPTDWAIWIAAGVVALNGLADQRTRDVDGLVSGATVSDLFRPDWWWGAAIVLGAAAVVVANRRGLRTWAASATGLVLASVATVAALLKVTESGWELMLYYPVKALWTAIIVVLPLAGAGSVWLVARLWTLGAEESGPRTIARVALALIVGILMIGVVGRGAAFPPHLVKIADGSVGYPNWSLAMVEELGEMADVDRENGGAIVFGIVPSASVGVARSGFVGMIDYLVMESLRFAGMGEEAFNAPVKAALVERDMTGICAFLDQNRDALRITGPNPAAGPQWIMDSGCPEDIVDPDSWLVVHYDPAWVSGSAWEVGFGSFPTVAQVRGDPSIG